MPFFSLFADPVPLAIKRQAPPGYEYVPHKEPHTYMLRPKRPRNMLGKVAGVIGGMIITTLILVALGTSIARSQSLNYDYARACRSQGWQEHQAVHFCIQAERRSLDYLNYIWDELPEASRRYCFANGGNQRVMRLSLIASCANTQRQALYWQGWTPQTAYGSSRR